MITLDKQPLITTELPRKFKVSINNKPLTLDDPNPEMTAQEVLNFYAVTYPELTTATLGPAEMLEDMVVYTFNRNIGVKG